MKNEEYWDNFRLNLAVTEILKSCQEQNEILCGKIKDWNNIDEKTKEDLPKLVKHFYSSADALANAAMDRGA